MDDDDGKGQVDLKGACKFALKHVEVNYQLGEVGARSDASN